jgi:hypothetical protein
MTSLITLLKEVSKSAYYTFVLAKYYSFASK